MKYKDRIYTQSIADLISILDEVNVDKVNNKERDEFLIHLISKTLLKSNGYNIGYLVKPEYDRIRQEIINKLMNDLGLRYLDNLILEYVKIPNTVRDELIILDLRGHVLIAKYQTPVRCNCFNKRGSV